MTTDKFFIIILHTFIIFGTTQNKRIFQQKCLDYKIMMCNSAKNKSYNASYDTPMHQKQIK